MTPVEREQLDRVDPPPLDCDDVGEAFWDYDGSVEPGTPGRTADDALVEVINEFNEQARADPRTTLDFDYVPLTGWIELTDGDSSTFVHTSGNWRFAIQVTGVASLNNWRPSGALMCQPVVDSTDTPRSFYLPEVDPMDLPVIRLPSDTGEVEARVGPLPDGGQGFCVSDAFATFPGRVACFEPDENGRLFVPLRSEGQPAVFIDDRVARVTIRTDVDPERDLLLLEVPGVPGARITQGTAEVAFEPDLNVTIELYDERGVALVGVGDQPPRA